MNVYFELDTSPRDTTRRYFAMLDQHGAFMPGLYKDFMLNSERVWAEYEDGSVRFIKNRLRDPWDSAVVDMKEFMWIKLRSATVCE